MRKLLHEISVIPGVSGTCIFDKTAGALCSEFKADLPADLTENVGIHFVRLMQMGSMNSLGIKSAHFRFDRYIVVGLPLETGAILLTVCDSDANSSLVATTAAMLAEDMRDELTNFDVEPAATSSEKGSIPAQSPAATLQPQLEKIEDALAGAIGPVAGIVLADYINRWKQNGPPEASRLPELVAMLAEEIGDPELVREFQVQVRPLLQ